MGLFFNLVECIGYQIRKYRRNADPECENPVCFFNHIHQAPESFFADGGQQVIDVFDILAGGLDQRFLPLEIAGN